MPAEAWPSFHCRPSTASTLLSPSASIPQTPTTFTNAVGSAPTVSFEKSSFSDSPAAAHVRQAANATPASDTALVLFLTLMVFLLLRQTAVECGEPGSSTTTQARSAAAARRGTRAAPPARSRPVGTPDSLPPAPARAPA